MKKDTPLSGPALVKEVCRRIRLARTFWDQHRNGACRSERERAITLYETLSDAQREQVPQVLRVWLRYRSEKYFGPHRTPPGGGRTVRPGGGEGETGGQGDKEGGDKETRSGRQGRQGRQGDGVTG